MPHPRLPENLDLFLRITAELERTVPVSEHLAWWDTPYPAIGTPRDLWDRGEFDKIFMLVEAVNDHLIAPTRGTLVDDTPGSNGVLTA